jgi:hypothetical protein
MLKLGMAKFFARKLRFNKQVYHRKDSTCIIVASVNMKKLLKLKEDLINALGDNLCCLLHTGSRVRGEATKESDYDVTIIVRSIDLSLLKKLQRVFRKYPKFSAYLLSQQELKTLPQAQFLQFVYSQRLYGNIEYELPTKEEVRHCINLMCREWSDRIRHYLIFQHTPETLAKNVYFALKYAYLCLSDWIFIETDKLPKTKRETISYFKGKKRHELGTHLLEILKNWNSYKRDVANNPQHYLYLLEKFFRKFHLAR